MAEKDYYKVLGVAKTAADAEIKKTYKKLAFKFHPDKNKGDKKAEDRFKEISEAYAVLSDKQKPPSMTSSVQQGFTRDIPRKIFSAAQILMIFSVRWVWAAMIFSVRYSAAEGGPADGADPAE